MTSPSLSRNNSAGTPAALLASACEKLRRAGIESPRLEAELLLAAACNASRARIVAESLTMMLDEKAVARFSELVERRTLREPLAYIVGSREFYGRDFLVNPHVLIPRPETELVVEVALEVAARRAAALMAADVGTGSGAIAITLALERPDLRLLATDISFDALVLARLNAERLGCAERIEFVTANLLEPIKPVQLTADQRSSGFRYQRADRPGPFFKSLGLIVANLPYIPTPALERLSPEVSRYEPRLALEGGAGGIELLRSLIDHAPRFLFGGGALVLEVSDEDQSREVRRLCRTAGAKEVVAFEDLSGCERVVRAVF